MRHEPAERILQLACTMQGSRVGLSLSDIETQFRVGRRTAQRLRDLTPQQFRVLQMLGSGLLNKQIGYELGVSEATVKAHVTAILRKLGASNRTQAVLVAHEANFSEVFFKFLFQNPLPKLKNWQQPAKFGVFLNITIQMLLMEVKIGTSNCFKFCQKSKKQKLQRNFHWLLKIG